MGNAGKKVPCQECGVSFSTRSNLFRHLKSKHEIARPKALSNITCNNCGKGFTSSVRLNHHQCSLLEKASKHGDKLPENNKKNVTCQKCSSTFTTPYIMYRHMRNIHQAKPTMSFKRMLQCAYCDATLNTHKAMDMHLCTDHNITLEIDKLRFDSFESFSIWKSLIEAEQGTYFVKRNCIGACTYFYCQRSGNRTPEIKKESQNKKIMSYTRVASTLKTGKCCPARIVIRMEDEVVTAMFHKVHIGHKPILKHSQKDPSKTEKTSAPLEEDIYNSQLQRDNVDDMIERIYSSLDTARQLLLCVQPENVTLVLDEAERFQRIVESLALKTEKTENSSSEFDEPPEFKEIMSPEM